MMGQTAQAQPNPRSMGRPKDSSVGRNQYETIEWAESAHEG